MSNTITFPNIHFIREILVKDYAGNLIPTMQSSDSNADALHPYYISASFYEHKDLQVLYHHLGGGRRDGAAMGSTVVIPNRTKWASMRKINAAEVTILTAPDAAPITAEANALHKTQTRARDALSRD